MALRFRKRGNRALAIRWEGLVRSRGRRHVRLKSVDNELLCRIADEFGVGPLQLIDDAFEQFDRDYCEAVFHGMPYPPVAFIVSDFALRRIPKVARKLLDEWETVVQKIDRSEVMSQKIRGRAARESAILSGTLSDEWVYAVTRVPEHEKHDLVVGVIGDHEPIVHEEHRLAAVEYLRSRYVG